jgi:LysR family transcriptional regulator, glycine cleavage system transcriptional activator
MTSRRKLPPLNALRAFEAAARHMSFKLAAEELFVTATAISHQIRHLENMIGYKLFERTPRSIALTDAGRRLYPVLRDGFDRFSRAVADLNEDGHSVSVSVTPAFAARLLVPALVSLQQSHPDIRLAISATERLADLARGEVDLAVRYGAAGPAAGLRRVHLYRDCYLPLASPSWAAHRPTPVPAGELMNARLVSYEWKNARLQGPTWTRWMATHGIAGFDEARCVQFSEESHAIQAAVDGVGVVLASDALVLHDLHAGRLVQVGVPALEGFTYQCLSLESNPKVAAIRQVEEWLRSLLPATAPSAPARV